MTPITTPISDDSPSKRTILLIEDYVDTRQMISKLLRRRGYDVIEAEDGVDGVITSGCEHPDLILMDLALPEPDGVEAARRIHATPTLAQIPIIVLSAYLSDALDRYVRAAGGVELFPKPFDAESFLRCIELTLGKHQMKTLH